MATTGSLIAAFTLAAAGHGGHADANRANRADRADNADVAARSRAEHVAEHGTGHGADAPDCGL